MEMNTVNGSTQPSDAVVLELLGIDKKWVKSSNGNWIDQRYAPKPESETNHTVEINDVVENYTEKKRWQFWKR